MRRDHVGILSTGGTANNNVSRLYYGYMVDSPKTSFIPKQTTSTVPGRVPHKHRHFNVFRFIGMVVFLCGMILAVGVFLYKGITEKALQAKKTELQATKSSYSLGDIDALKELDHRIIATKTLLSDHLSPSVIFDALELRTQKNIGFTDFSYERRESGSVEVVLKGTAIHFNTVALQSRQFADATVLAHTIFSGLTVDDKGQVHFVATSEADRASLAYTGSTVTPPPFMSTSTVTASTTTSGTSHTATSSNLLPLQ